MRIRPAEPADAAPWERMRGALWPIGAGADAGEHARAVERYFTGERVNPLEVLLACDDAGRPIGFVELSLRPWAEGCVSELVAFLEGWYVEPASRRSGVGRALVAAAGAWARARGCTELASDTELDNAVGEAAHRAVGFAETGRVICFRLPL